jgi:hypothetical protein
MDRPFVNNVEEFFSRFILTANGQKVADYLKDPPDFENADFIIKDENILIELKCLEKDIFSDEDFERNEALVEKWFSEGILNKSDIIPVFLGRKPIPEGCLLEILKLSRRTFQKIIEKGNKQLRITKEKIGNTASQKVLMICNDGNYFFDNARLSSLLFNIVGTRNEIDLDCVIYFTVNQSSRLSNSELDWAVWIPAYGERARIGLEVFINDLSRKFNTFYNNEFGIEQTASKEFPNLDEGALAIKEMQYISKEVIYKNRK